jgi:hypothetical protein
MGFDPVTAIGSAVVSNVVGKALGGGGSAQPRPTSGVETVAGSEFQPFTYKSASGLGVTGSQVGDHGYEYSTELPSWMTQLGAGGAAVTGNLFDKYYQAAQQDPYEFADEYYKRGMDVLTPQFEQQNTALQERLFGTGRLGAVVGGVNPEAYSQQKAQQETLANLYASSLSQGQAMQTNRLNQLSQAAEAAKNLGMLPMTTEMDLVKFASDLEAKRSNALKAYTQQLDYKNTPQQVFGSQIGNLAGQAFGGMFNGGGGGGYFSGPGGGFMGSQAEFDTFDMMPFDSAGSGGFFSSFNPFG